MMYHGNIPLYSTAYAPSIPALRQPLFYTIEKTLFYALQAEINKVDCKCRQQRDNEIWREDHAWVTGISVNIRRSLHFPSLQLRDFDQFFVTSLLHPDHLRFERRLKADWGCLKQKRRSNPIGWPRRILLGRLCHKNNPFKKTKKINKHDWLEYQVPSGLQWSLGARLRLYEITAILPESLVTISIPYYKSSPCAKREIQFLNHEFHV